MLEIGGMNLATNEAMPQKAKYQRIARFYDLVDLPFEHMRYRPLRRILFEGLHGRILDAGVGTGRNIAFYPEGSQVVGVDLSPAMLLRAERRRAASQADVQLLEMNVTRLEFPDKSFDAAVGSFLFCTLPEVAVAPALRELARVLKPGGTLRLLDYREPQGAKRRFLARLWQPWADWAFGASFTRKPERHFAEAGLVITRMTYVVEDLICVIEGTPAR
jgi:ubiquinone/menaquinone biosynthesis C-methylase UbiE